MRIQSMWTYRRLLCRMHSKGISEAHAKSNSSPCQNSGGHRTRLPLGKVHRRTSKKFCAFLEVYFCLVLLSFQGRRTSKKFLRNLSLV